MSEENARNKFRRTLLFSGVALALQSPAILAQDDLE